MKLEQLRALERAATAGPWETNLNRCKPRYVQSIGKKGEIGNPITVFTSSEGVDGYLIAEARNALPALLKVAEAAQRLVNPGTLPACLTEQARFHIKAMVDLGKALAELEAQ